MLFVDEIHRFNKAQQDAFLPHVEGGTIILIGATTENPSFEVIAPLLSRTRVAGARAARRRARCGAIVERALADRGARARRARGSTLAPRRAPSSSTSAQGDARVALGTLEVGGRHRGARAAHRTLDVRAARGGRAARALRYDKAGEEHYNVISAFIKSMRGSDPDAAVYWLMRMLEAGEDPLFIARRMVIFAAEDVGNAEPQALPVAVAAKDAVALRRPARGAHPAGAGGDLPRHLPQVERGLRAR